jgi:hypothetical protein
VGTGLAVLTIAAVLVFLASGMAPHIIPEIANAFLAVLTLDAQRTGSGTTEPATRA